MVRFSQDKQMNYLPFLQGFPFPASGNQSAFPCNMCDVICMPLLHLPQLRAGRQLRIFWLIVSVYTQSAFHSLGSLWAEALGREAAHITSVLKESQEVKQPVNFTFPQSRSILYSKLETQSKRDCRCARLGSRNNSFFCCQKQGSGGSRRDGSGRRKNCFPAIY